MTRKLNPPLRARPMVAWLDEHGIYWRVDMGKDEFALIDDADLKAIAGKCWGVVHNNGHRYLACYAGNNRMTLMHRLLLSARRGVVVDHRDNDGINNRRHNIRLASDWQNKSARHRTRGAISGYRGVYPTEGAKWSAMIWVNVKPRYLGRFDDPAEAARVWDKAAREARGEFTYQNFPDH